MTFTATLYRDTFGLMFGLGLFFVKLSSCSLNSMLRASSSQRFSIGESPDERESRSVTQRLFARIPPRALSTRGFAY
jgi:hypothetical protein